MSENSNYTNYSWHVKLANQSYIWPDFGKPTKLSQLGFWEIPILNIEATMVLSCYIIATLVLQYN